jgi:hypothetical protein
MKLLFNETRFIDCVTSVHTGGNIFNDIITLKDFKVIVITDNCIYYFTSIDAYESNEDPLFVIER